jgi:tRNA uridine 5-carboxymethylaminomethyl modification enzyme
LKTPDGRIGELLRKNGAEPCLPEDFFQESASLQNEVIYRLRYRGYLEREARTIAKFRQWDHIAIPSGFSFSSVKGLRTESRFKLEKVRPTTLGQASRISGVNPADVTLIMLNLR